VPIGSGSGLDQVGRVSLTFWKKSGQGRVGSGRVWLIYMLCFFRSLIDFDWIEGHLISGRVKSGRVRIGSDQLNLFKKSDRIGFESGWIGRIFQVGSDSATSNRNYYESKTHEINTLLKCLRSAGCM
jgi:hypothetical protein